ncbi:MAG: NYN domain-containing protein [Thermoleophilia bacterium]
MARAYVYVDGFNLYHRRLKPLPNRPGIHRWLDPDALARFLLPEHDVVGVRYFTADLAPTADDPGIATRQQTYLRALRTVDGLTIHKGQFKAREVSGRVVLPESIAGQICTIERWEEKGTDVSLGAHLVADAFLDRYDIAAVISNDSDLREPVRLVREEVGKVVGVLLPIRRISRAQIPADFVKAISAEALRASQFPDELVDRQGRTVRKPAAWSAS